MKKMTLWVLAFVTLAMASCEKNASLDPEQSLFEAVALSAARFAAQTDSVTTKVCKGKLTEIETADLPASVSGYITTNFSGSEVVFAGKDAEGRILVGIKLADGTHKGLLFAADGTFTRELVKFGKRAKLTKIEVSALPSSITSYVTQQYPNATIKHAGQNEAGEYFLHISNDTAHKILVFNADGTFKQEADKSMMRRGKHKGFGK